MGSNDARVGLLDCRDDVECKGAFEVFDEDKGVDEDLAPKTGAGFMLSKDREWASCAVAVVSFSFSAAMNEVSITSDDVLIPLVDRAEARMSRMAAALPDDSDCVLLMRIDGVGTSIFLS
jgi:hypothetical protein